MSDDDGVLWGGRFSAPPAPEARALGRSLDVDLRLAPQDAAAGVAHVHALREAGLLSRVEAGALAEALEAVGRELAAGTLAFEEADEDVHSVIERAVSKRLGDLGAKLHAGRSRNDLVVTDLRLWLLSHGPELGAAIEDLIAALVARAREHAETVMPGSTHGRAAQPVTLGHHLLAHAWALTRDLDRLDAWAERTSVSPLGAGALATSTLGLDPRVAAEDLGFALVFPNSIDAVGDRDFAQEFVAAASIAATHVSRLAADLARWTEGSLGWARFDDAYATGSSMMPHKQNPDVAELARGKAARIAGDLVTLTGLAQGLPAGYQRDLQEDKAPIFDAWDTMALVLPAITGAVATLRFDAARMREACDDDGLYATDLAEALVREGVPFREAHRRTGELLKRLDGEGRELRDLDEDEWAAYGVAGGSAMLDPDVSVAARAMPGGPSPTSVRAQVEILEELLRARASAT